MKAIVCTRYGATEDVVELRQMPKPTVGPQDVLIAAHAASVNPIDYKIQRGDLKVIMRLSFPFVMGFDVSGIVVETGAQVTHFKPGDAVFARVDTNRFGTFAEFVATDAQFVAHKPAQLSHAEAAALPLAALTAWQALYEKAHLKQGQKVLIHAGSGGVGSLAIQLAKHVEAQVATTTSTANVDLVKSLGADVVIDYKTQKFEDVLQDYDAVFETLGGANQEKSFRVLKPGGVLVSIVGIPTAAWARQHGLPFFMPWLFDFMNRNNNRLARKHQVRFDALMMTPNGKQLEQIAILAEEGKLKPVIDRVFPLEQTQQALLHSQSGRSRGKIVIQIAPASGDANT
ncbi:MAG: NADP-dependent oxidoreductase [Burkholderiaceae bacterium]|nr:MAG: NADP-dependent oxidoreductase [Burkholderiaceae bacterium]